MSSCGFDVWDVALDSVGDEMLVLEKTVKKAIKINQTYRQGPFHRNLTKMLLELAAFGAIGGNDFMLGRF